MIAWLDSAAAGRMFRPLDVQAARLLARIDDGRCPELPILAALASWASGQGHTCLPLSEAARLVAEAGLDSAPFADPAALRRSLLASPAVGRPGEIRPLVLDRADNLFLFRLDRDEETIARALRQRAEAPLPTVPAEALPLLENLFPATASGTTIDWQRAAAALALCRRFVVISGGPGTGKTHTAARILALLAALAPTTPRVALAAPTGKAALRLQESIRSAKAALPPALAETIPEQAQTLHRLLGYRSDPPGFRHHDGHPLRLDLLILDEASMIDVPLMAAVLAALPPACRVILLGDRDQLASVEAGNLFGDLCGDGTLCWSNELAERMRPLLAPARLSDRAGSEAGPLADSLVVLRTSRRFGEDSGIGALARAVNTGDPAQLETVLQATAPDLHLAEAAGAEAVAWLQRWIERHFQPLFAADGPQQALEELGRCRLLCALREGPAGVEGINRLAESLFRRQGLVAAGERLYRGMPLLILRNDYDLGLFNGDTGILWPDGQGVLHAWFAQPDGTPRPVALVRLPAWQTAFALTVHKAQGSEFDRVLCVLPQEDAPILSRELLYTGITRARQHLTLLGRRPLLHQIVRRRVRRYSGLDIKLRQKETAGMGDAPGTTGE
ncbi:exodeoxyribonuclease V subunit alpha [Desulfobulbus sp.]|uniref:exodeoxyribonuclease V subunit alpha n=1 Tax=Desulfobulbus sp. TaxID=895 RepID=UPI00286F7ACF|nr:exodeoxyribonuclease V subunit alpha [Desulfobulbus sp.]